MLICIRVMHQAGYPKFIQSHVTDQALQEADSSSLRFVCRKVIGVGVGGGRLGLIPVKGSKTGSMKKLMLANPLESSGGSRAVQSRPRMGQGSCSSVTYNVTAQSYPLLSIRRCRLPWDGSLVLSEAALFS